MLRFRGGTYDGDDLLLDQGREGHKLQQQSKVELQEDKLANISPWVRSSRQRTEDRRRPKEMVCCARVMVAGW